MKMKTFLKEIWELIQEIIIAFFEVNLTIMNDLKSFRNKLVFFTCLIVFIVCVTNKDYRISVASLGLLEIFLCYYFKNRKQKEPIKEERCDDCQFNKITIDNEFLDS